MGRGREPCSMASRPRQIFLPRSDQRRILVFAAINLRPLYVSIHVLRLFSSGLSGSIRASCDMVRMCLCVVTSCNARLPFSSSRRT